MIRLISQRLAANTHVVQMVVAVNQKTVANLTKILS